MSNLVLIGGEIVSQTVWPHVLGVHVHKNASRGRGARPLHLAIAPAHSSRTPFYATLQV